MLRNLIIGTVIVGALSVPTHAHSGDWLTGNPILDGIRMLISLNNTSKKIQNTDFGKTLEKSTIEVIEEMGSHYADKKAIEQHNQNK